MSTTLVSISLLCGVLQNAHAHFIHMTNQSESDQEENDDRRTELRQCTYRSFLYHLAKIYDLRQRYFLALEILERAEDMAGVSKIHSDIVSALLF